MGRLTPDEFRKKYAELPPNLREAYGSVKTTEILEEIGKKHGLRLDQIGELVDETGYVMLGATPPSDYVTKLEEAAGVNREQARAVATDVNERVFKPIRDALKRVHKIGEYRAIPPKDMAAPITRQENIPEEKPAELMVRRVPQNLSEERLTKTFSLPREEREYTVSGNGTELKEEVGKYALDPYREPIE